MPKRLLLSIAALGLLAVAGAQAETFPARQVTIIVPFAAGGPSDVIARIVADQFAKRLGQPFERPEDRGHLDRLLRELPQRRRLDVLPDRRVEAVLPST